MNKLLCLEKGSYGLIERRAALLALHVAVKDIAGLKALEAVERDAALHALAHLGDAILEVLERVGASTRLAEATRQARRPRADALRLQALSASSRPRADAS